MIAEHIRPFRDANRALPPSPGAAAAARPGPRGGRQDAQGVGETLSQRRRKGLDEVGEVAVALCVAGAEVDGGRRRHRFAPRGGSILRGVKAGVEQEQRGAEAGAGGQRRALPCPPPARDPASRKRDPRVAGHDHVGAEAASAERALRRADTPENPTTARPSGGGGDARGRDEGRARPALGGAPESQERKHERHQPPASPQAATGRPAVAMHRRRERRIPERRAIRRVTEPAEGRPAAAGLASNSAQRKSARSDAAAPSATSPASEPAAGKRPGRSR